MGLLGTEEPVASNHRSCGYCGRPNTKEGHDGCAGVLPGVMNACCGHGAPEDAYVQLQAGGYIHGGEAIDWIRKQTNRVIGGKENEEEGNI